MSTDLDARRATAGRIIVVTLPDMGRTPPQDSGSNGEFRGGQPPS